MPIQKSAEFLHGLLPITWHMLAFQAAAPVMRMVSRTTLLRRVASIAAAIALVPVAASAWSPGQWSQAALAHVAGKLERRFGDASPADKAVTGLVVLGGGMDRAQRALRLARRYPQAQVLLSGPSRREEAVLARASDVADRLTIDRSARTTYENALFSRRLAAPKAGERWLLVTSGVHMPRAIGAFRAVGFAVEPAPVWNRPAAAGRVPHELLGLVYYRLLGRTQALLPRPAA